ncbi:hypothetical protein, partial [Eubacterium pyruvativorans]|uniref:hypothetical protein n=1 Tax=Eubacterium pyruvativorans TaxID=155865 RepID=UPI0023F0F13B
RFLRFFIGISTTQAGLDSRETVWKERVACAIMDSAPEWDSSEGCGGADPLRRNIFFKYAEGEMNGIQ